MKIPFFIKIYYINFFYVLLGTKSAETRVLGYILRHADYRNRVCIKRIEVALAVDCGKDTITNVIKDLVACDLMRPDGRCKYMLNPECAHRGPGSRLPYLKKEYDSLT